MFKKESKIINTKQNLGNYISGHDVYNSELLVRLADPSIQREYYEITTYEYRPDLIAKDYYGSASYEGFVVLLAGIGLENYRLGAVLSLIPKTTLDRILGEL